MSALHIVFSKLSLNSNISRTRREFIRTRTNGRQQPLSLLPRQVSSGPKFIWQGASWLSAVLLLLPPLPAPQCFSCHFLIIEHYVCYYKKGNHYISSPALSTSVSHLHIWKTKLIPYHLCKFKLNIYHVNLIGPHTFHSSSNVMSSCDISEANFFEMKQR